MPAWVSMLVTLILGLLGGGGLVSLLESRSKNKVNLSSARANEASARVNEAESWGKLVKSLEDRIERMNHRVEVLEKADCEKDDRIQDLEDEIEELREWIRERGLTPPPRKPKPPITVKPGVQP